MSKTAAKKKGFIIYHDFREVLQLLDLETKGKLLDSVIDYSEFGKMPEAGYLGDMGTMAFTVMKLQIDRNADAYEGVTVKRREAAQAAAAQRKKNKEIAEAVARGDMDAAAKISADASTCYHLQANVSTCKQVVADIDTDKDTDTERDTERDTDTEIDRDTDTEVEDPPPVPPVNHQKVIDDFNAICHMLPKAALNDSRRAAIRAVIKAGYTPSDLTQAFMKVAASSFLTGGARNGWRASFDWIMKAENLQKIREGNYDDREPAGKKRKTGFHNYTERGTDFNAMTAAAIGITGWD